MSKAEEFSEECRKIRAEIRCLRNAIVNLTKFHEETFSDIVDRLDQIFQQDNDAYGNDQPIVFVDCRKWSDFSEMSKGASLVAFETDIWNVFSISSACREFVFRYAEKLPLSPDDEAPADSVCCKVLDLDPLSLRRWLSDELNVPEDKIIEGNLVKPSQRTNEEVDEKRESTILEYYKRI